MNKKNIKKSLDLSFAYGTSTMRQLDESGCVTVVDPTDSSTGDTTIRAVTSLFSGTRQISGLDKATLGYDPYDSTETNEDFEQPDDK